MPPVSLKHGRMLRKLAKARWRQKKLKLELVPYRKQRKVYRDEDVVTSYEFSISRPNRPTQKVTGDLFYYPKSERISIGAIETRLLGKFRKKDIFDYFYPHKDIKGKALSRGDVKYLIKQVAKKFPKARVLTGIRTTGVHGPRNKGKQTFDLVAARKKRK